MIRHFATEGNLAKKYIGVTDEPLCEDGKRKLKEMSYPAVDAVFVSPLRRCVETATLIYEGHVQVRCDGLKECCFGDFENKNYKELASNLDYQRWIHSKGTLPFPNGEKTQDFKERTVTTFNKIVDESIHAKYESIALVVHGGTIMSILDKYSHPHEDYYKWQVKNGNGYVVELEKKEERLTNICVIH